MTTLEKIPETMKAALWYGIEDMRLEERGVPQIGPGEVLVKVGVALTCGTDFKLFRHGHPHLAKQVPAPFGHELAGTVVKVGSSVKNFNVGMRVVAAPSAPCGKCFHCERKEFNLCENLTFMTGAYAEYIRIPAPIVSYNLLEIPDGLSYKEAALTEPLACVVFALDQMQVQKGETLCILGAGPCGLMFLELAKSFGASVIVVGRGREKLEVAQKLGADHVLSIQDNDVEASVRRLANRGHGPDLVIEAVGRPETWEKAFQFTRKGGRLCLYGGCPRGSTVTLDTHKLHYEDITVQGVFHYTPEHFRRAAGYLAEKRITTDAIVVGEKRLSELKDVFQRGQVSNPLKIAIVP